MKVSIILNKFDERSVQSVIEQTHQDWELIIESEGQHTDSRIKFISFYDPNKLEGEYVLFLRAEERLLPTALELLTQADADIVEGPTKEFKYKNPSRFAIHDAELEVADHTSAILIRRSLLMSLDWNIKKVTKKVGTYKRVSDPVAEKFFPKELIDKWEKQRDIRRRRQMKMSVIFGLRSRSRYAKRVLRSLLVQDLPRDFYDIIVVDFGSQDDIKEYVEQVKASNVYFIEVPEAVQYDRALAFNIGAKESEADILVFSEADLVFPKSALRAIRDAMIGDAGVLLRVPQKDLTKLQTCTVISKTYSNYEEMGKVAPKHTEGRDGCLVMERPTFESIGGFDEDFTGESYEVEDLVDRLRVKGTEIKTTSEVVLHMWHDEIEKANEGYFWELYQRKTKVDPNRNVNREWGILTRKRPSVLFLLSPNSWECGSIGKHLGKFLSRHYKIDMCGARKELRGKTSSKYDIVYSCDWRLPREFHSGSSKFVTGISDFTSWTDGSGHNVGTNEFIERLKLFEAVSVTSEALRGIVLDYHPNTFYTPVGVDTEFFRPLKQQRVSSNFTAGWVGWPEDKHTVEGYLEHIKPVCHQLKGVDLFAAPGGEDLNGHIQMLGFYNAIDILVQFPESAGHSKSILEAMSCGKPVVVTKAADTLGTVVSGVNGIVVNASEEALTTAILTMKSKDRYAAEMGKQARETVVKEFDWRDQAHYWKEFFDFVMDM